MAAPWDSVVSIGGQSFVDGIWRVLQPALEGLSNPIPVALPGFSNARMRVTQVIPEFPSPPGPPGLKVRLHVEVVGEVLLHVIGSAATGVDILLGAQSFSLTSLTGDLDIPVQNGTLSNIAFPTSAINLGTGTGAVQMPAATATLANVAGAGTLALPNQLSVPPVPVPSVVPVPVDLTPSQPMEFPATLELTVTGPNPLTRNGLLFRVSNVTMGPLVNVDPNLAASVELALNQALAKIAAPLGMTLPAALAPGVVATLLTDVPAQISAALDDALTRLAAETGRLLFPPPGTGASCDVRFLPTSADASLVWSTDSYLLQVAFKRAGSTDITTLPSFTPASLIDVNVLVGNSFVLSLMCCLVERLPAFSLPSPSATSTVDVANNPHTLCCNFTGVTANFAGFAIGGGGLSVCIDGPVDGSKTLSLVGRFNQNVPNVIPIVSAIIPNIAAVSIDFTLPLGFDLDDASSIANLRVSGAPTVAVAVTPSASIALLLIVVMALIALVSFAVGGGLIGAILAGISLLLGPVAAAIVILLLYFACGAANYLLDNATRTLLSGASLVRSPIAVPPGMFEAFGRFSPVTVEIDDLEASGVLHTPTSPWALLPRIGRLRRVIDQPFDFPVDRIPDRPVGQPRPAPEPAPGAPVTAAPGGGTVPGQGQDGAGPAEQRAGPGDYGPGSGSGGEKSPIDG